MKSQDFKAKINDTFEFDNISLENFDVVATGPDHYHILRNNRSYNAELVSTDFRAKEISMRINGTLYQVKLLDPYDLMVQRLGLAAANTQVVKEIKAPMPGLVLQINVAAGDKVEKGKGLLILEAMKMENVIRSVSEGHIKSVKVEKGQAVEKNQLLIEME